MYFNETTRVKRVIKKNNKWYYQEEVEIDKAAVEARLVEFQESKITKLAKVEQEQQAHIDRIQGWLDQMKT